MKKPFRSLSAVAISLMIALSGVQGTASATPATSLSSVPPEITPYAVSRVQVKCPIVNLRNEATGEYIWGFGNTKAAAVKDANNKLYGKKGTGFKLKHCRMVA